MRITFTQRATDFEMYAPDAFARSVGGMVNFTVDGFEDRQVRLIAAEVAPDGKSVEVTVDVPREAFPHVRVSRRR